MTVHSKPEKRAMRPIYTEKTARSIARCGKNQSEHELRGKKDQTTAKFDQDLVSSKGVADENLSFNS